MSYAGFTRLMSYLLVLLYSTHLCAGKPVFSAGIEVIDIHGDRDYFDVGYSLQLGYEFHQTENWSQGFQLELMNGWSDSDDFFNPSDLRYQSRSLFLTSRHTQWPIKFKLGLVKADYQVLQNEDTFEIRSEDKTGVAIGIGFGFSEKVQIELIDIKLLQIGNDRFYSIFFSIFLAFF